VINFRFHLVSLIAVFLALAVGVVMGYGVLGQPTVDTLQGRVDTVEARANEIRAENDRLLDAQARLETVFGEIDDFVVTNRLSGIPLLPVAVRGVDASDVIETVRLARLAGAAVPGIVWLEEKWGIPRDGDATDLAAILGVGVQSRPGIREAAARALGSRLSAAPGSGRTDLLTSLGDQDFLSFEAVDDQEFDPSRLDGRSSRVLVVVGSDARTPFDRAALPLVRALAASGRVVVVADEWRDSDDGAERGAGLAAIRDDDVLSLQVTTVDHLDTPDGPLATVLAIAARGLGTIGHYGFGRGAERGVPEWWIG
jgi:hypothetical protein